jgi:hypothetical protein
VSSAHFELFESTSVRVFFSKPTDMIIIIIINDTYTHTHTHTRPIHADIKPLLPCAMPYVDCILYPSFALPDKLRYVLRIIIRYCCCSREKTTSRRHCASTGDKTNASITTRRRRGKPFEFNFIIIFALRRNSDGRGAIVLSRPAAATGPLSNYCWSTAEEKLIYMQIGRRRSLLLLLLLSRDRFSTVRRLRNNL